jgi:hypothetical protein
MTQVIRTTLRKPSSRPDAPGKTPFWRSAILVPAIPLLIGFGLGSVTEWRKDVSTEERLYLEQRMKVFAATSDQFAPYVLNWGRTIKFARYEWELAKQGKKLTDADAVEKVKNLDARRRTKDQLYAQLEVAKLFFSAEVASKINAFKEFDGKQDALTVDRLPAGREPWEGHHDKILAAMIKEVRTKR